MKDSGSDRPATHFAPAGRSVAADLQQEIEVCIENPVAQVVLESLDGYVMVLNRHRQILAANSPLLEALEAEGLAVPEGARPGEALGCVHVPEGPDGCGTSRACSRCGQVLAVLAAQAGTHGAATGECLLSMRRHGAWSAGEYRVQARALDLHDHPCVVLVMHDISAVKRKEAMEALFFHDVLNLLQGLTGWGQHLGEGADPREAARRIVHLSERITHQVQQQRLLQLAEQGQLLARLRQVRASSILEDLDDACRKHAAGSGRTFEIVPPGIDPLLHTDPDLLLRVLQNMGVNALEAVAAEGQVRAGFRLEEGAPCFYVWNQGAIPEQVALSIFQRSFSTKAGKGRGLGTYAMKLLGENLLGGRVGFHSSAAEGTTFHLRLPGESLLSG